MWSNLPSHLRTGLGAALLLVIGVAVASFTLSFIALREVASNPAFGWGRNAWIFPACVDMALVACEVVYVSVSMIRGVNPALPFCLMVLFGAATVWFNVERVPAQWRMVTAIPPLAGIFMTLLIAYLLKVFARITGKAWHHEAPPLAYGSLGVPGSPIQGALWRPDAAPYAMPAPPPPAWGPYGHLGSPAASTNGHSGQELEGAGGDAGTKRALIEMYLSGLSATQLQVATGSSIVAALGDAGVTVSGREANRVLDAYRSAQQAKRKR
jgi:hypothetical protein